MKVGFLIYDDITLLDLAGVYDPLIRVKSMGFDKNVQYELFSYKKLVNDFKGIISLKVTTVRTTLEDFDLIIIPGGFGTRKLMKDEKLNLLLKTISSEAIVASVCSGSLLLGASGLLLGKQATTHKNAFKELKPYCKKVLSRRIVKDGRIITAGGVTSSIDLGLYLVNYFYGYDIMKKIAEQMEYKFDEKIFL